MSDPMTTAELAEIRALADGAPESIETEVGDPGPMGITASSAEPTAACERFYAASRSAVPRLLADRDALVAERAMLQSRLAQARGFAEGMRDVMRITGPSDLRWLEAVERLIEIASTP